MTRNVLGDGIAYKRLSGSNSMRESYTTRRIVVEIEVPEGVRLEELFRGVKYRVVDPVAELEDILEAARKKQARIDKMPLREEIYAERTGY